MIRVRGFAVEYPVVFVPRLVFEPEDAESKEEAARRDRLENGTPEIWAALLDLEEILMDGLKKHPGARAEAAECFRIWSLRWRREPDPAPSRRNPDPWHNPGGE